MVEGLFLKLIQSLGSTQGRKYALRMLDRFETEFLKSKCEKDQ